MGTHRDRCGLGQHIGFRLQIHQQRQGLLHGGSGGQYDGLANALPAGSRPTRVAGYVRTAVRANVGYLALGGGTLDTAAVFFHLKSDGTAGLLASDGSWHARPFRVDTWLHVVIRLDWAARTAQLTLDGETAAEDVAFVTQTVGSAEAVHLFNSDRATVWWDDITIAL